MKNSFRKEIALYFSYLSFIKHPSLQELEEKIPKARKRILLFSFVIVQSLVWVSLYFLVKLMESFEFMQTNPENDLLIMFALVALVLSIITIANILWVWLMRSTKLASEKSILRVIRYFK
jgi:hypothetical protein